MKFLVNNNKVLVNIFPGWLFLLVGCLMSTDVRAQDDTLCARVSIEIRQEVSFERQAFEARMTIRNGLPEALSDVSASISFLDENDQPVIATYQGDPNSHPTDPDDLLFPRFFFRPFDYSGQNGTIQSGGVMVYNGTIAGKEDGTLTWLIIPTEKAAGSDPNGKLFFVGATVTYTVGGQVEEIEVAPDYIFVKPVPSLRLDYFLPGNVYGDDLSTLGIQEPPIPFNLGVRVINLGAGPARDLTIESAQPEIASEDGTGLLVDFRINESQVNGQAAEPDLLVNFGDLEENGGTGVARWIMTASLNGTFENFRASISHADELGGEFTSLINKKPGGEDDINAYHPLLKDVFVDRPGTIDSKLDFLAFDDTNGNALTVFDSKASTGGLNPTGGENDRVVAVRLDGSNSNPFPSFSLIGSNTYRLTMGGPALANEFLYLKTDTLSHFPGFLAVKRVIRSDGKPVSPVNAWVSAEPNGLGLDYCVNLFDFNNTGNAETFSYEIEFGETNAFGNRPPQILPIAERFIQPNTTLRLVVRAVDADGDYLSLSFRNRPAGSNFVNSSPSSSQGAGFYNRLFEWTPGPGQQGVYAITFVASDGVFNATQTLIVHVSGDSPIEAWQKKFFADANSPQAALGADPDSDGMNNLYEYGLGLDPTYSSVSLRPKVTRERINSDHFLIMKYVRRLVNGDHVLLGVPIEEFVADDGSLDFEPLAAGDPRSTNWVPVAEEMDPDQTNVPDGFIRIRAIDSVSLEDAKTNGSARVMRLKVSY